MVCVCVRMCVCVGLLRNAEQQTILSHNSMLFSLLDLNINSTRDGMNLTNLT